MAHLAKWFWALTVVWLIVVIAAVGAAIYREIDGPSIRSMHSKIVTLETELGAQDRELDSTNRLLIEERLRVSEIEQWCLNITPQLIIHWPFYPEANQKPPEPPQVAHPCVIVEDRKQD